MQQLDLANDFDPFSNTHLLKNFIKSVRGVALKLFESYLKNRYPQLRLGYTYSSKRPIEYRKCASDNFSGH